jgi:flap endonuclease-1
MGIRNLNSYLRNSCPDSIRCVNLADLSGKRIAVDISIYLYKYETDGCLIENIYAMLSIFRNYNIIPIFIFDGKPPPEKKELLAKRREDRVEALQEYDKLKSLLEENNNLDYNEKQNVMETMINLKRQIVQITKDKIETVKTLIRSYGATYYDAPGEADELCALLVKKKKVWACLSEDMDLFVYGCTRVLRYFSLMNHTAVMYYMKGILQELNMTHEQFKQICILSGTDYNIHAHGDNKHNNLYQVVKYFNNYRTNETTTSFYKWLQEKTDCISDIELLNKINIMFDLNEEKENLRVFNDIKIINGPIRQDEIINIMRQENFIFCLNF